MLGALVPDQRGWVPEWQDTGAAGIERHTPAGDPVHRSRVPCMLPASLRILCPAPLETNWGNRQWSEGEGTGIKFMDGQSPKVKGQESPVFWVSRLGVLGIMMVGVRVYGIVIG